MVNWGPKMTSLLILPGRGVSPGDAFLILSGKVSVRAGWWLPGGCEVTSFSIPRLAPGQTGPVAWPFWFSLKCQDWEQIWIRWRWGPVARDPGTCRREPGKLFLPAGSISLFFQKILVMIAAGLCASQASHGEWTQPGSEGAHAGGQGGRLRAPAPRASCWAGSGSARPGR